MIWTAEEKRENQRRWRAANPEKQAQYKRTSRERRPEQNREINRRGQQKRKMRVLIAYGGPTPACVCCGTTYEPHLSIDHINEDGAEHRRSIGGGGALYPWLVKHGFPPGFQVMCFNCNWAKHHHGTCSCQEEIAA